MYNSTLMYSNAQCLPPKYAPFPHLLISFSVLCFWNRNANEITWLQTVGEGFRRLN